MPHLVAGSIAGYRKGEKKVSQWRERSLFLCISIIGDNCSRLGSSNISSEGLNFRIYAYVYIYMSLSFFRQWIFFVQILGYPYILFIRANWVVLLCFLVIFDLGVLGPYFGLVLVFEIWVSLIFAKLSSDISRARSGLF